MLTQLTTMKVIAATNRIDILDPALLRSGRLDWKFEFPLPNDTARSRILQIHSRKMATSSANLLNSARFRQGGSSSSEMEYQKESTTPWRLLNWRLFKACSGWLLLVLKISSFFFFLAAIKTIVGVAIIKSLWRSSLWANSNIFLLIGVSILTDTAFYLQGTTLFSSCETISQCPVLSLFLTFWLPSCEGDRKGNCHPGLVVENEVTALLPLLSTYLFLRWHPNLHRLLARPQCLPPPRHLKSEGVKATKKTKDNAPADGENSRSKKRKKVRKETYSSYAYAYVY